MTSRLYEEWRAVPGFEGFYEVSSLGNVRSIDRVIETSTGKTVRLRGRTMAQPVRNGYPVVTLSRSGKPTLFYVHRLVALAFLGEPQPGIIARHLNDVKTDNRVENLAYGSQVDNMADMKANSGHYESKRETCPRGHALVRPNLTQSSLRVGRRNCLACNRAKGFLQKKPDRKLEFRSVADSYYKKIMEGSVGRN